MSTSPPLLRVFVYGTLQRGQRNHLAYCQGLVAAEPAQMRGRLYHLPPGYPMLAVPGASILAIGTHDYLADLRTQDNPPAPTDAFVKISAAEVEPEWQLISGELLSFADAERSLPGLDRLEDFRPGGHSHYWRALVRLAAPAEHTAWTYVAPYGELPHGARPCGTQWP